MDGRDGGGNHSEKVEAVQVMVDEWSNNGEVINYGFPGKHYSTPLWQAVINEYLDIVQILLAAKSIDVNKAPTSGWGKGKSPLDIALEEVAKGDTDYKKFVKVLKKAGAKASETKGGAKKRKSINNSKKSKKQNKTQKTKSK